MSPTTARPGFFCRVVPVLIAWALAVGSAPAAAVVLELPGLAGGYEGSPTAAPNFGDPTVRTVTFTIPAEVTSIDQLELVLATTWTHGELLCQPDQPEVVPWDPPLALFVTSSAFPGDFFSATVLPPAGDGELRAELTACCPPGVIGYDALLGAELTAELSVDAAIIGICSIQTDTHGTVWSAALELTGVVATEPSSWTSIKRLYR